jgi:streptogramin lyase
MVPTEVDTGMSVPSGGRLWIQRGYPDGFAMIDPDAKEPSAFQQLPGPVTDSLYFVSVNPHQLWVSDWDANAVYEIDPAP